MPVKYLNVLPALVCAGSIAFLSFISPSRLPDVSIVGFDKLAHALAYGILYHLTVNGMEKNNGRLKRAVLVAVFITMSYGLIIEWLQGHLTMDREMDVYDAAANAAGIVVFCLTGIAIRSTGGRRAERKAG